MSDLMLGVSNFHHPRIAVSGDWAAIGVTGEGTGVDDCGSESDARVYLFRRSGNGRWKPGPVLASPDLGPDFGNAVALSGDILVVSGGGCDPEAPGRVIVYRRAGDEWQRGHILQLPVFDWTEAERAQGFDPRRFGKGLTQYKRQYEARSFGGRVSLHGDTLIVGRRTGLDVFVLSLPEPVHVASSHACSAHPYKQTVAAATGVERAMLLMPTDPGFCLPPRDRSSKGSNLVLTRVTDLPGARLLLVDDKADWQATATHEITKRQPPRRNLGPPIAVLRDTHALIDDGIRLQWFEVDDGAITPVTRPALSEACPDAKPYVSWKRQPTRYCMATALAGGLVVAGPDLAHLRQIPLDGEPTELEVPLKGPVSTLSSSLAADETTLMLATPVYNEDGTETVGGHVLFYTAQ